MAESKFEKFIVRKPAVVVRVGDDYIDKVQETDTLPVLNEVNTGPRKSSETRYGLSQHLCMLDFQAF
jgi:hypothetical protein